MKKTIIILAALSFIMCGENRKSIPENTGHEHETASGPEIMEQNNTIETHEHKDDNEHKIIRVGLDKQKSWGIQVSTADTQNISSRISLPGIISLNENRTAYITSFVNGQITQISADLGDRIKKGQSLLTVNSPEFAQAQSDFLQTRAKYNLSRKEFERAARLRNEKAIEEKEYLRREAEHEKLTMEYAALGSNLHSFGITHDQIEKMIEKCSEFDEEEYKCELADPHLPLLSPISGTVISRDAVIGDFIKPDKVLFTISDLNIIWAHLDAYEKDIPFIKQESRIFIKTPLYPDKLFDGQIIYISDMIDANLRTIKVRVKVDNTDRMLKPNMYIQGLIENELQYQKIIAVPEEAVQTLDGQKIVFIPEEEEIFAVRHVQTGDKIGDQIIINSGLKSGEKFVLKGAFTLKTELTKAAFGHSHVH